MLLGDHHVDVADGLDELLALRERKVRRLALAGVELVGDAGDDQVAAESELLCAPQDLDVAIVKKVDVLYVITVFTPERYQRKASDRVRERTGRGPSPSASAAKVIDMTSPRFRAVLEGIPSYAPGKPPNAGAVPSYKLSSNENPYPPLPGVAIRRLTSAKQSRTVSQNLVGRSRKIDGRCDRRIHRRSARSRRCCQNHQI